MYVLYHLQRTHDRHYRLTCKRDIFEHSTKKAAQAAVQVASPYATAIAVIKAVTMQATHLRAGIGPATACAMIPKLVVQLRELWL